MREVAHLFGHDGNQLYPVFSQGLQVLIIREGYVGWKGTVLKAPKKPETLADLRRAAVVKFLKGESALGTPQPLGTIPAQEYVRKPVLKKKKLVNEGC